MANQIVNSQSFINNVCYEIQKVILKKVASCLGNGI